MSEAKLANSNVKTLVINEDNAGQRIDNYLLSRLKGVPKSRIYKILRSGEVRVNKGRIKPGYRLQEGDTIRIPPVRMSESTPSTIPEHLIYEIQNSVLYEDPDILAINKPAGMAVHAGSGIQFGIIDILRTMPEYAGKFLELAHRLDRQTSGCLILCKNRDTLTRLNQQMNAGNAIEKHYLALTLGHWPQDINEANKPLMKNIMQSGERLVKVDPDGKKAISIFTQTERFDSCSLVDVQLLTGRTHQIRVHAASENHAIAGDDKYGDKAFNRAMKAAGLKRMFLHARRVAFEIDNPIEIIAPLDDNLKFVLDNLRKTHD